MLWGMRVITLNQSRLEGNVVFGNHPWILAAHSAAWPCDAVINEAAYFEITTESERRSDILLGMPARTVYTARFLRQHHREKHAPEKRRRANLYWRPDSASEQTTIVNSTVSNARQLTAAGLTARRRRKDYRAIAGQPDRMAADRWNHIENSTLYHNQRSRAARMYLDEYTDACDAGA